jgi:hypothetical protein
MPNTDDLAVAIYNTHDEAEQAVKTLERAGFDMRKLSIVGKDYHTAETAPDWLRPRLLARTAGCWVVEMPVRRCKRSRKLSCRYNVPGRTGMGARAGRGRRQQARAPGPWACAASVAWLACGRGAMPDASGAGAGGTGEHGGEQPRALSPRAWCSPETPMQ